MAEIKLPTEEEIREVPRFAQVAFAARCARRVEPLFKASWSSAPHEHTVMIHNAIEVAELVATNAATRDLGADDVVKYAIRTSEIANVVQLDKSSPAAIHVVSTTSAAAVAASDATKEAAGGMSYDTVALKSAMAASSAVEAAEAYYAHTTATGEPYTTASGEPYTWAAGNIQPVIREDFERLRTAAEREGWTNDTPVPPEFFGPLWPNGAPKGWPPTVVEVGIAKERDSALGVSVGQPTLTVNADFHIWIDPGEASVEDIQDLFQALSDVHRAAGGTGLRFVEDKGNVRIIEGVQ